MYICISFYCHLAAVLGCMYYAVRASTVTYLVFADSGSTKTVLV